uniref:Wsv139-like protein n=1 Tax=Metapenaeus ensis nimavirus TaxID=2133794 RepID=A0A401IPC0_9VIRU|nr:MAG: wsv139-like protein [Metapenaeus ensis nimavirus]GBG35452.1 wsv139-like protein [Metapenaeus ensis nimavirus]
MGIPDADRVYANTYGAESTRVIKEAEEKHQDGPLEKFFEGVGENNARAIVDITFDMVDLPTFSVAAAMTLGKDVASKMMYSPGRDNKNMGQMVIFYLKKDNSIVDTLHDKNNVLTEADITGMSDTINLSASMTDLKFFDEFRAMLKRVDADSIGIKRVPITIPHSLMEVERLVDPPLRKLMMTPPSITLQGMDYNTLDQWLSLHSVLKPRSFLTNDQIINSEIVKNARADIVFKSVFYASELEGLILLYGHRLLSVIKRVLQSPNISGRYVMFFVDGHPPAIKKITRLKRKRVQAMTEVRKKKMTEDPKNILIHLCERMILSIPTHLTTHVITNVIRIPLMRKICAKNLYLSLSFYSEAEDDIVRMVSCLLDLETPTNHFSLSKKKRVTEYGVCKYNKNQKNALWSDVISTIRAHTNRGKQRVSVNLFSRDSDVLAKWNLIVAHHHQVCNYIGRSPIDPDIRLEKCRFYRSKVAPAPKRDSLGGVTQKRHPVPDTIYDLSESPVYLSPESTIMIMLMKGSDYNTPLVSDSTYDYKIRSEFSMFERLTCTCISGWATYLKSVPATRAKTPYHLGNVSLDNLSSAPCESCGKYLVLPFWSAKFFFAAQASEFMDDAQHICFPPKTIHKDGDKYHLHKSMAINTAANVMAGLTMGNFNQRVFGGIINLNKMIEKVIIHSGGDGDGNWDDFDKEKEKSDLEIVFSGIDWNRNRNRKRKRNGNANCLDEPSPKYARDTRPVSDRLSTAVYKSIQAFFHNHTEGGIPLHDGDNTQQTFLAVKQRLFGNVFPTAATTITKSDFDCFAIDDLSYGESPKLTVDEKNSKGVPSEQEFNKNDEDWLEKAERVFNSSSLLCERSSLQEMAPLSVSQAFTPPQAMFRSLSPINTSTVATETISPHSEAEWLLLAQEFERSLSPLSLWTTENSILTRLSGILIDKTGATIKGVDDPRVMNIPYSIKTMNLLIILYLNMCGLEDARIVGEIGQLMPQLHVEYCSSLEKEETDSGETRRYNTDRINFMSAALEFTYLNYMSEIRPSSPIKQKKRQNWKAIEKKLIALENLTRDCTLNCKSLRERLKERVERLDENVFVPREGFMPVMGIAISRPWSVLTLWSSFLYFHAGRQNA